jgi:hypothetical protein
MPMMLMQMMQQQQQQQQQQQMQQAFIQNKMELQMRGMEERLCKQIGRRSLWKRRGGKKLGRGRR